MPSEPGNPQQRRWPPCVEVIDDRTAAIARGLTPEQRWQQGRDFFEFARSFALAAIRSQHPEWTEQQVSAEWLRRIAHEPT